MQFIWIILTLLWVIIFVEPNTLSYIVGAILVLVWWNMLLISFAFKKWIKDSIKFWWYEIYRNKK